MKRDSVYSYPAVFTKEKKGMYSVSFPDITGCVTCGDDIADAILMASDALALMLYSMYEEKGVAAPDPTPIKNIKVKAGEFASYVVCDTKTYRRKFGSKAVKKTLTIPEWMNTAATEQNINFSQVLQEALQKKLDVS
ncbi:MAG: type II toxin-antitoxin system HicB family antitoxin [Clostridiales bacterium]|nr:type II toxin-antitoxin system HicB family antitoxin [Clostridiales bacterium]